MSDPRICMNCGTTFYSDLYGGYFAQTKCNTCMQTEAIENQTRVIRQQINMQSNPQVIVRPSVDHSELAASNLAVQQAAQRVIDILQGRESAAPPPAQQNTRYDPPPVPHDVSRLTVYEIRNTILNLSMFVLPFIGLYLVWNNTSSLDTLYGIGSVFIGWIAYILIVHAIWKDL